MADFIILVSSNWIDMDEIDLRRAAAHMIQLHGPSAALEARRRADKLLASGDVGGFHAWKRVVDRITDVVRQKPDPRDRAG